MKNNKQPNNRPTTAPNLSNKHRPENKDNLDSREGEEQEFKGDDTTHNGKERKSAKKATGKK